MFPLEAFERATVEATLIVRPVIGTANSGGAAELFRTDTGLLYDSRNHVELADKIQYLHENPRERSRLGTAGQIWITGRSTQGNVLRKYLIF